MAMFSLRVEKISRSQGRSAVASAAYHAGETLRDHKTGITHTMPARPGLVHSSIYLPHRGAPEWACVREALWNEVEASERRIDSTVALMWMVVLPRELKPAANVALAETFARYLIERFEFIVDLSVRDEQLGNPVAVLLSTSRRVSLEGFSSKIDFLLNGRDRKTRGLKGAPRADLVEVREKWAQLSNAALEAAGINSRVDHRSFKDRGIDLIPATHLGPVASRRTKRGEDIDRTAGSVERDTYNAHSIMNRPEVIHDMIAAAGDRFDRPTITQVVSRYVDDQKLQEALCDQIVKNYASQIE